MAEAAEAVSMEEAVAVASMGTEARIAVAVEKVVKVAGDRMAEEATAEAEHRMPAAVQARPHLGRRIAARRIFVPPSTTASGIRSATAPAPLGLPVQAQDASPQDPRAQPSWLATPVWLMGDGTHLPGRAEAGRVLKAEPAASEGSMAALASEAGSEAGVVAEEALDLGSDSAGVGVLGSDGRSGALTGDRTPGLRGGIPPTPTDTIRTGTHRTQRTTIIRTTATIGPPIRRLSGRRMMTTSQQATRVRPARRVLWS